MRVAFDDLRAMARKKYDIAVIGAGLNGLILAHALGEQGKKVALIEANEKPGGLYQATMNKTARLPEVFQSHTFQAELNESFQRWSAKVDPGRDLFVRRTFRTKIFDSGKWKDFLGFGDKPPAFVDQMNPYCNSEKVQSLVDLSQLSEAYTAAIEQHTGIDLFVHSHWTAVAGNDHKIESIDINDGKKVEAEEYVYTASLWYLEEGLRQQILQKNQLQALAKADCFSSVHIQCLHAVQDAPDDSDFILSAAKEKTQACYGQLRNLQERSSEDGAALQISSWMSFVEQSQSSDMEVTGDLLREMKRQIKRAFPELFSGCVYERVFVSPHSHCQIERKDAGKRPTPWQNLSLIPREWDRGSGLMGRIDAAVQWLDERDVPMAELSLSTDSFVGKSVDSQQIAAPSEALATPL